MTSGTLDPVSLEPRLRKGDIELAPLNIPPPPLIQQFETQSLSLPPFSPTAL